MLIPDIDPDQESGNSFVFEKFNVSLPQCFNESIKYRVSNRNLDIVDNGTHILVEPYYPIPQVYSFELQVQVAGGGIYTSEESSFKLLEQDVFVFEDALKIGEEIHESEEQQEIEELVILRSAMITSIDSFGKFEVEFSENLDIDDPE